MLGEKREKINWQNKSNEIYFAVVVLHLNSFCGQVVNKTISLVGIEKK